MNRMPPWLVFLGVCLALILVGAGRPDARMRFSPRNADLAYLGDLERAVFRLTNEARQRHGVSPLTWDSSLGGAARAHSADMLQQNYFSHQSPDGRPFHERLRAASPSGLTMSAENIWSGTGYDPGDTSRLARMIVDTWLASPGHRQNLLNPEYTAIGVGVVARGRDIRATQVFGGRR